MVQLATVTVMSYGPILTMMALIVLSQLLKVQDVHVQVRATG